MPVLVGRGHDVIALARSTDAAGRAAALGADAVGGNLDDPESLHRAFARADADVLVNLASLGFGHAPAVIAATTAAGIGRAVFVSTTAIFTTLSASSKATRQAAEALIVGSELSWTIIRPTMIYGTLGDRNMARLLEFIRRRPVVVVPGTGRGLQQPVHVDDVAAAVTAAAERPGTAGTAYDVAGPDALTLDSIIAAAAAAVGRRPLVVHVPLGPATALVRAYERVARRPRVRAEQLERLAEDKAFDIGPARRDLDFRPRSFVEGIRAEAEMLACPGVWRDGPTGVTGLRQAVMVARTARHLRPSQAVHRARLRTQRAVMSAAPGTAARYLARPVPSRYGWPSGLSPLDAQATDAEQRAELSAAGSFRFLGEARDLGAPPDWQQAGADQLWRFHLHYFEWAWALHAHADREWARRAFAGLWRSWQDGTPFGRGDGWAPYVVSLRAWALCGVYQGLVAASEIEHDYLESLALHAGFVRAHLELDVGGNHLVKNLKALIGLGVFLGDDPMVAAACTRLDRQLCVQVLADGGHYERSPSYHCQVLGDLVDVGDLLDAAGLGRSDVLAEAVASMRRWLGVMVMPDGDVPLFNDCGLVGPERIRLLGPVEPAPAPLVVLWPSGYAVVRPGEGGPAALHLVADVGPPCPPDLPAHAHADCLSFELAVGGRRVITNAGTSTYAPGRRRAYERSTRAHTTVEVDGADQTEVWATFRAGRRATPALERTDEGSGTVEIVASHDGYRRLAGRPVHRRTWTIGPTEVAVVDEVTGDGDRRHRVVSSVHLAAGTVASMVGEKAIAAGPVHLVVEGPVGTAVAVVAPGTDPDGWAATGFGDLRPAPTVRVRADGALPLRLRMTIAGPSGPLSGVVGPSGVAVDGRGARRPLPRQRQ